MIIYNVTVSLDPSIRQDWLNWMKTSHIPDVMNTGYFLEHKLCKEVLVNDELTYAIPNTLCKDHETLSEYQQKMAPKLQVEHRQRYEGKFAAFRTFTRDHRIRRRGVRAKK